MPKHGSQRRKKTFGEINITPLTDVFLVLLTIMMLVAPILRQMRADITLPDIVSGTEPGQNEVTVNVTADGKFFVDTVEVQADTLGAVLKDKAGTRLVKRVLVQADRETRSGTVLRVFRAAEEAQYDQVTVVGQVGEAAPEKDKVHEGETTGTVQ